MKKTLLISAMTASLFASVSLACATEKVARTMPPVLQCGMQEQVTVSVNYNFKAKSFAEAKKMFEEQNAKVTEFAKQQKIDKFELNNQNYNIYSQPVTYRPDGTPDTFSYQVNGASTYLMTNADTAFKFAEFLTQQNIQVSLNSNAYRNSGICGN